MNVIHYGPETARDEPHGLTSYRGLCGEETITHRAMTDVVTETTCEDCLDAIAEDPAGHDLTDCLTVKDYTERTDAAEKAVLDELCEWGLRLRLTPQTDGTGSRIAVLNTDERDNLLDALAAAVDEEPDE